MATIVQRFSEGAYIITDTGEEIPVYEGMEIYPGDQLIGDIVTLDVDVANDPGADPTTILPDDLAAIQQAILEGADPTQVAERTAAGGDNQINSEDGGGSSFVALDRTGNEVDPFAGYDTIPINFFVETISDDANGIAELETPNGTDTRTNTGTDPFEQRDEPTSDPDSPDGPEEPENPEEPEQPPVVDPEPEDNGQNNGWGNGDQDAPGNSEDNNNAENSDNDPPPGISNNPNLNTNDDEDTEDEQDSGDTTETTDNGDSSSDIYGDNSPSSVDDIDGQESDENSTDSDTGTDTSSTDDSAGSDTINPSDVLDDEEDTIPGLGKDKVKEDNPNKDKNNGWGNGDQDAPGNSLDNNNAENNLDGLLSPTEQYYDT